MRRLVFEAPAHLRETYRVPGQFLDIQAAGGRGYFALASAPSDPQMELLIKEQGGLTAVLCEMPVGGELDVGEARGLGFDLSDVDGASLHLFSMGSGIAPLRALIRSILSGHFRPNSTHLWQGAFSKSYLPYPDEFPEWERQGISVEYCFDQEGPAPATVPDLLAARAPDLSQALCFWIGSPAFGESVIRVARSLGAPPERVRTNF